MRFLRVSLFIIGAVVGGFVCFTYLPMLLQQIYGWSRIPEPERAAYDPITRAALAALGLALGAAVFGNGFERAIAGWDHLHPGDRVNIFIGTFFGVIVTVPFGVLFSQQGAIPAALLSAGMMLLVACVAVYALRSIDDMLPWSRNAGRGRRSDLKVLDTSVIIDARIVDIVQAGFLDGRMYVPKFVLEELQRIADSGDSLKRQRGKRGLDALKQLQSSDQMEVANHDRLAPPQGEDVDARLVRLARSLGGVLVTNDHNLNRVAALQDVKVLNINELALALRPTILPGENLSILVYKEGSQMGQGVGYLDDGTMVVIEGGRKFLGTEIEAVVTQVHQTERGKMIFAEAPGWADEQETYRGRRRGPR